MDDNVVNLRPAIIEKNKEEILQAADNLIMAARTLLRLTSMSSAEILDIDETTGKIRHIITVEVPKE